MEEKIKRIGGKLLHYEDAEKVRSFEIGLHELLHFILLNRQLTPKLINTQLTKH